MSQRFKSIVNKIITEFIPGKLFLLTPKILKAKSIFEQASEEPVWLERDVLESLQQKYSSPPEYCYDPKSLEQRGKERAGQLLRLIPTKKEKINTFLELGCWDGMVNYALQRMGKISTGIDNRSDGFDERAVRAGIPLLQMDAAHLQFEDESFDCVFSYGSIEHFAKPELVLQEAIRVAKRGGYIYLESGPLYMSPLGLHAYDVITVPYCQFLFPRKLLNDFVNARGLYPINYDQLNGWSLENYHKLWKRYSHKLKRVRYHEEYDLSHVDLIMKHPSCFKSKTKCFTNFIVGSIEVLFKKIS